MLDLNGIEARGMLVGAVKGRMAPPSQALWAMSAQSFTINTKNFHICSHIMRIEKKMKHLRLGSNQPQFDLNTFSRNFGENNRV